MIKGNGGWSCISKNILHQKISGFDSAVDTVGGTHLLGYDREGSILYLRLSPDTPNKPRDPLKEEGSGSATSPSARIKQTACMLFTWQVIMKGRCGGFFISAGRMAGGWKRRFWTSVIFNTSSTALSFATALTISFSFTGCTKKMDTRWYCAVLKKNQISRANIFLGESDHYCFFPDALAAPDNSLHISWISRKNNIMFINYARRSPQGKWENHLCTEISQGSAPFAPLYFAKDVLLLTWQNNNMLFCLISRDGGDSWKWGTKVELDDTYQLIRFRSKPRLLNDPTWRGNYTFSPACPPETYMQPEVLLKSQPEKDGVSEELEMLDLLSSRLLIGYDNLQASNVFLNQKIEHQKKELAELYSINLAKTKTLQEKLASKNIEITKIKNVFQNTIDELKAKISREREEMASANHELQQRIKALQEELEKREKNNLLLTMEITRLKKEINLIKKEYEHLQNKGINYYFKKLLRRDRK